MSYVVLFSIVNWTSSTEPILFGVCDKTYGVATVSVTIYAWKDFGIIEVHIIRINIVVGSWWPVIAEHTHIVYAWTGTAADGRKADNFTGASVGKRKQYDANGDEMKYGRR